MRLPLVALIAVALFAPPSANAAIVGGVETEKDWPFMGYIENGRQEMDLGDGQFCGASLIAPTWALTAAHCVTLDPAFDPLVTTFVIGRHAKSESGGERIQVRRAIQHQSYGNPMPSSNDVMLLELERAPRNAQPVQIAGPAEASLWAPGVTATIIGWGNTSEGGNASDVLMEAQVPIVTDSGCASAYPGETDAATMLCAGFPQGGTDTCQGDSGGPLVVPAPDGSWRQAGVTSWGDGCARAEKFGVYSRIAGEQLRNWVAGFVPAAISNAPAPTARSGEPAPAPSQQQPPPPASAPAPSSQPAPASAGKPRSSAAKRRASAAKRKKACLKKAKRIKSAKKRKRAVRACSKKR